MYRMSFLKWKHLTDLKDFFSKLKVTIQPSFSLPSRKGTLLSQEFLLDLLRQVWLSAIATLTVEIKSPFPVPKCNHSTKILGILG